MLHATEVRASQFRAFKRALRGMAKVSILSRYTVDGVSYLDVEVSRDNAVISCIERRFA